LVDAISYVRRTATIREPKQVRFIHYLGVQPKHWGCWPKETIPLGKSLDLGKKTPRFSKPQDSLNTSVDGSEIPLTTWDVQNPVEYWDKLPTSTA